MTNRACLATPLLFLQDRADRLLNAATIADQNAKLSVFCTRPAIYSPVGPAATRTRACTVACCHTSSLLHFPFALLLE